MSRGLRRFVVALWIAFVARGVVHSLAAPMWDGFDEPFHLAYAGFVADHGRPPSFTEPSFPAYYIEVNSLLPSTVGHGAPTFAQWREMASAERLVRRRDMNDDSRRPREPYQSANYERQQGPLFYLLAAIPLRLTGTASLPLQLLALRLFCVALASLIVPLSARFLFRAGGERLVIAGLGFAALAPNTIFYADRVTNESLAWLFVPLIGIALVDLASAKDPMRSAMIAGIFATLAIWTKLTLLPAIPAAFVAWLLSLKDPEAKRVRAKTFVAAAGVPLLAMAGFFAWNRASGGGWTGLAEASATKHLALGDVMSAAAVAISPRFWWQIFVTHVWSGGWGFVRPANIFYVAVFALVAAIFLVAISARRAKLERTVVIPVATFVVFSMFALMFHAVGGAIAARQTPGFPPIGAEGWYFDVMRAFEALVIGWALLAALGERRASEAGVFVIAAAAATDLGLTTLLMLPHWSASGAFSKAAWSFDYAPLPMPALTIAALTSYAAAVCAAMVFAMRARTSQRLAGEGDQRPSEPASPSARIRTSSS